jgi:hypothetical protein
VAVLSLRDHENNQKKKKKKRKKERKAVLALSFNYASFFFKLLEV